MNDYSTRRMDHLMANPHLMRAAKAPRVEGSPESLPVKRVGSGDMVVLPSVDELPRDIRRRVEALSQHEWTEEDWTDLLYAQRIVAHNVALRHGLLQQHNTEVRHARASADAAPSVGPSHEKP
jgi:hypothetical protein